MANVIQLDPRDNVLVALEDLRQGDTVSCDGYEFVLNSDVGVKHKFPVVDLAKGDSVYQYGVLVGRTTQAVRQGELLHVHNLEHAADHFGPEDIDSHQNEWRQKPDVSEFEGLCFDGYHREDGQVGTANHWVVIPMVFCENRNLQILEECFVNALGYGKSSPYAEFTQSIVRSHLAGEDIDGIALADCGGTNQRRVFRNIAGVKFLRHTMGCGSDRGDAESLCALLAGYATHPNVVGVTVLSLGCQHAQVSMLQKQIRQRCPQFSRPLLVFEQQQYSSEQMMLEAAIKQTFQGLVEADKKSKRQPAPISKLTVGLECGGSDGFSGISANPAIGHVSDCLSVLGAKSILSEFPELCGVEAEIIKRCESAELAKRFIELMRAYNDRARQIGADFSDNPSPGNIRDGLITDAIKSAGAAKKGGTAPIVDVLDYTEPCTRSGLNLLCTPGNDVESTTAMAGSWANVILFSTGLGTPTGNAVCPVVKIASNSKTAKKHDDLIDFNAGVIVDGKSSIAETGEALLRLVIEVASGRYETKAVKLGQDDFIPWRRGVSL